ncbi:N-acetylmuramate alpha-1-phosphate uridylyltransferase MurU [Pollutimonas sp. M17]|uniref:N-acetylmuramate alpha-1-phosphate uridylyltransferase MurU n=1 Tax=Pollutimonas sp. M17 TaxID=2962065 RepID=UPI0021F458EE|nr:nucleotidyltransferase family protein [Pollutimonas sp. M17]UYO94516.1 nucleotidyltransferase family protein [Pollutimonas sp. M17]
MRAMILAAGRGERMRPLTDTTPKPLLQAGGRPLIAWHLMRLARAGITELIVNHAWLGGKIEEALGDGRRHGVRISYSAETQALETAGGIVQALDFFQGQPFLVINGDVWCDWDPALAPAMAADIESRGKLAWLLMVDNPVQHPDGDFRLDETGLLGTAQDMPSVAALTFSGIGVYRPALFEELERGRPAPLAPLLRQAMHQRLIVGGRHDGDWVDVGTPERLAALDRRLAG